MIETTDGARRYRWCFAAAFVAVASLRWHFSRWAHYPRIFTDEGAYLSYARYVTGGTPTRLGLGNGYGVGYSLLIAPVFKLDLSPTDTYRAVILVNVLLGALTFVLFEKLARRIPQVTRPQSIVLASVAALLPGLTATTSLAWSDNLTPAVFALMCLAIDRFCRQPTPRSALLLGALAPVGYLVHGRLLPVAPLLLAMIWWATWRSGLTLRAAALANAVSLGGLAIVRVSTQRLYQQLYPPGNETDSFHQMSRIRHVNSWFRTAFGQYWSMSAASAALAGLGIAVLAGALVRSWQRQRRLQIGPFDSDVDGISLAMLSAFAAIAFIPFAVAVTFMTHRERIGSTVYGRYNDMLLGPFVMVALAFLTSAAKTRTKLMFIGAAGGSLAVAAAAIRQVRYDVIGEPVMSVGIMGVTAISQALSPITEMARITAIAGLAFGVLSLAGLLPLKRLRQTAVIGTALVMTLVGSDRASERADPGPVVDPVEVTYVQQILEPNEPIYFKASGQTIAWYRYQWYLEDHPFIDDITDEPASLPSSTEAEIVVASPNDAAMAAAGYELFWIDSAVDVGFWIASGSRQDRLTSKGQIIDWPVSATDLTGRIEPRQIELHANGDLNIDVDVEKPAGQAWPTQSLNGPADGRVRMRVEIIGTNCHCPIINWTYPVGPFVQPDATTVPYHLVVPRIPDSEVNIELKMQLLVEGDGPIGEPIKQTVNRS